MAKMQGGRVHELFAERTTSNSICTSQTLRKDCVFRTRDKQKIDQRSKQLVIQMHLKAVIDSLNVGDEAFGFSGNPENQFF